MEARRAQAIAYLFLGGFFFDIVVSAGEFVFSIFMIY
jgi:hypothetical protein